MRSIRNLVLAVGCAIMLVAAMKPAAAATINYVVNFSAAGFNSFPAGTVPPYNLVLGQFEVTFDPSLNSAGGPMAFDFILPTALDDKLGYIYTVGSDTLELFNALGTNLYIQGFTSGSPILQVFAYSSGGTTFTSNTGLVHVAASVVATTPIPAALPLFAAALGGLGFAAWRRRRNLGAAA